jgi:hypothetical protein
MMGNRVERGHQAPLLLLLVTANPNVASGCPSPASAYAIAPPASGIPATASITAIAIVTVAVVAIAIVTVAIVATATAIAIVTPDGAAAIVTPATAIVAPATTTTSVTDKCHDTGRALDFQDRYRGRLCRP